MKIIAPFQPLLLNASTSVDDDAIELLPFVFSWHCQDGTTGAACTSQNGDDLDVENYADEGLLSVPAGVLRTGELQKLRVVKKKRRRRPVWGRDWDSYSQAWHA